VSFRDYETAEDCCKRAQLCVAGDKLQGTLLAYLHGWCLARSAQKESYSALQLAVCSLETFVLDESAGGAYAVGGRLAVHMLSPSRHLVDPLRTVPDSASSSAIPQQSVRSALVQLVLEGYTVLVDRLGKAQRWRLCDNVNDRCIDVCNALLPNRKFGVDSTTQRVLTMERAHCFRTKALLYKDNHIACDAARGDSEDAFVWEAALPVSARSNKHSLDRLCEGDASTSFHRLRFDSNSEAVAILLQVAAHEYEAVDLAESLSTSSTLAAYIMNLCQVQPFQLEGDTKLSAALARTGVDRRDLAERAVEAWKKVALVAAKKVAAVDAQLGRCTGLTARKNLLHEQYYFLQQGMMAQYNAGICAFHCCNGADATAAEVAARCLQAAETIRRDIDKLLSSEDMRCEFDLTGPRVEGVNSGVEGAEQAGGRSLHGYYVACGDLSYHLAQAHFRSGEYREMLQSAHAAGTHYAHSERLLFAEAAARHGTPLMAASPAELEVPLREMSAQGRQRLREAHGVTAVALSAMGEDKRSLQAVRRVADLCLGPIEGRRFFGYSHAVLRSSS
jgi:hypothetical protein